MIRTARMDLGWRGLGFESSGLEGCRDELVSALVDWIDLGRDPDDRFHPIGGA